MIADGGRYCTTANNHEKDRRWYGVVSPSRVPVEPPPSAALMGVTGPPGRCVLFVHPFPDTGICPLPSIDSVPPPRRSSDSIRMRSSHAMQIPWFRPRRAVRSCWPSPVNRVGPAHRIGITPRSRSWRLEIFTRHAGARMPIACRSAHRVRQALCSPRPPYRRGDRRRVTWNVIVRNSQRLSWICSKTT